MESSKLGSAELHERLEERRAQIKAKLAEVKDKASDRYAELRDELAEVFGAEIDRADDEELFKVVVPDEALEGVAGGGVSIKISSTLTTTINGYMKTCKASGMSLEGVLAGLRAMGLTEAELALAEVYVRSTYATISF